MATARNSGPSPDVQSEDDQPTSAELEEFRAFKAKQNGKSGPDRYRVVVANKGQGDRVLFSSVSKKRAMAHIERTCPRGSHHFLLCPDGTMLSYEHERHTGGPQGEDVEPWQEFDRDAYQAPDLAPVNTSDPWADAWEGAQ